MANQSDEELANRQLPVICKKCNTIYSNRRLHLHHCLYKTKRAMHLSSSTESPPGPQPSSIPASSTTPAFLQAPPSSPPRCFSAAYSPSSQFQLLCLHLVRYKLLRQDQFLYQHHLRYQLLRLHQLQLLLPDIPATFTLATPQSSTS